MLKHLTRQLQTTSNLELLWLAKSIPLKCRDALAEVKFIHSYAFTNPRDALLKTTPSIVLDKWDNNLPCSLFRFRTLCCWLVGQNWFDNVILLFIAMNCITLAMERPNIPPDSTERLFLATSNYVFTVVFTTEMFIKVLTRHIASTC